jgi:hypothetical protein
LAERPSCRGGMARVIPHIPIIGKNYIFAERA